MLPPNALRGRYVCRAAQAQGLYGAPESESNGLLYAAPRPNAPVPRYGVRLQACRRLHPSRSKPVGRTSRVASRGPLGLHRRIIPNRVPQQRTSSLKTTDGFLLEIDPIEADGSGSDE